MYAPESKFVWDYWIIKERDEYHLFHLQAPRSIIDPDKRHFNTSIGHALSTDLVNWMELPDALGPDPSNPFENKATHTGSIIKHEGIFFMLYTGAGEKGRSICLATSKDLLKWEKHPENPVLMKDARYYDVNGCWADPYLFKNPGGKGFYTFFKAQDKGKPEGYRGCIGAAYSEDFIKWEVLPPVFSPSLFKEPEVPAVYFLDNKYYLIMMTIPPSVSDLYKNKIYPETPQWGDIYTVADNLLGPYGPAEGIQLTKTDDEMMMVRLLNNPAGELVAMSWWQGYEYYWKDWIKEHKMNKPPCLLNNPRHVKLVPSKDTDFKKLIID